MVKIWILWGLLLIFIEQGNDFMMAKETWRHAVLTIYPPLNFGIESKSKKQQATLSLKENFISRNQQIQN